MRILDNTRNEAYQHICSQIKNINEDKALSNTAYLKENMLYLIPPRNVLSFNDFTNFPTAGMHKSSFSIAENDRESKLEFDFPGAKPEDILVTFDNGALTIKNEDQDFCKSFAVDSSITDTDKVEATLKDGVLTLVAPKRPKPDPVEIPLSPEPVDGKNASVFTVDLPGVQADNVSVSLDNSHIVLKASRNVGGNHRELRKSFQVDAITHNLPQIKASLLHGVLTVYVPLKPKPAPVNVLIQTEEASNPVGEDDFQIATDMPGVKVTDASVKVEDDVLHMMATRTFSSGKVVRLAKATHLDKRVQRDLLRAELIDGVLSVSAPRAPLPAPRTIAVGPKTTDEDKSDEATL